MANCYTIGHQTDGLMKEFDKKELSVKKSTENKANNWIFHKKQIPSCGGDRLSPVIHRHPNLNLMKKTLVRLMHSKCIIFFEFKNKICLRLE